MKKNIYVLEDDPAIRDLIDVIVDNEKFNLSFFENVKGFNEQLKKNLPQMVILDTILPDGNGADICEDLKSNPSTAHIPVMLMSANATIIALRNSGSPDDFLPKPFDVDDFLERLETLSLKVC